MFRNLVTFFTLILMLVISGCGSNSGGSISLFTGGTVSYSAVPISTSSTVGTTPTVADSNAASIALTATPYANAITAWPFTVKNIVIKYTKTNDSTFVMTEQLNSSYTIPNSGSVSIPVTIASSIIKDTLIARGFATGTPWNFYVNASFTVEEAFSGNSKSYADIGLGTVQFQ